MAVYAWGFGKHGQLGTGKTLSSPTPLRLKIAQNGDRAVSIYTGGLFTAVLTQKGDVYLCGCGKYGRLGTGSEDDSYLPTKVEPAKDAKVLQLAAGSWHACAVTFMGRLYTWGYNSKHNVLGRLSPEKQCSFTPGLVPSLMKIQVKAVSCGHNFTLVCTSEGQVYSWGCGRYGVLGHNSEECVLEPRRIESLSMVRIESVNAGYAHCGALSDDGRLFMFGKGWDGALGFGSDIANKLEPTWLNGNDLISVDICQVQCSVGEHRGHTLALSTDGVVYAWGSNFKGKLGLGDQDCRLVPTPIPVNHFGGQKVRSISAGGIHSGAITQDGRVWTWGCGKDGRLGHVEMVSKPHSYHCTKPKLVQELENVRGKRVAVQIDCSHYHTVVLLELP